MRPDRSTSVVVALFRERWPGGCLPRGLIATELRRHGTPLPIRTMDWALAKAVRQGELAKITSYDGGGPYCLGSFARANPWLVRRIEREPWRSMNSTDKTRAERAVRRMQDFDARHGAHDLRNRAFNSLLSGPDHKCIACGYALHKDPLSP